MGLETLEKDPPQPELKIGKRASGSGGGGFPGQGGDDGSKNMGGGFPPADTLEPEEQEADKARIITWFLLLIVLMTFGGLVGAYVVVSTNTALEWRPFDLPVPLWASTLLILASSVTYHLGKLAVDEQDHFSGRRWLVTTAGIGGMFIASQMVAWLALYNRGLFVQGNPYAGFFYILTAVHAVHVLGGITALGAILLRAWNPTSKPAESLYRKRLARSVGWYWHFMGLLWVFLFMLLGFWK
ncbi:MAG TPA: cytochrome c oxidase subunit 3 [Pyrinomonadaceae bacterium]|nr:cytochrome c oxidase subunit 3 [Pyrinomonadaceae bacterium]